jgi:dTDP-4-dehydrorhamnose reductase
MKILISGGRGNLATEIIKANKEHEILSLPKEELNVCSKNEILSWLRIFKPDIFIHTAALTRPMIKHVTRPDVSIETNIIGTSNVVLACMKHNVKLIYISTDYIYPCTDGNYSEEDALLPVNEYAWSKLGGECAVKLYENSLILRMALCQQPFPHPKALVDIKKSYLYMDEAAKVILKLINETGVINVGGDAMTPYEFVSKDNPGIEEITFNEINDITMGKDSSMNISKMKNILNDTTI